MVYAYKELVLITSIGIVQLLLITINIIIKSCLFHRLIIIDVMYNNCK